jgi:hypothetical protein
MPRTKVFISYSRKDKSYLDELSVHFHFLKNQYEIDFWSDREIKSGTIWREEIKQALATTRVAILLVSPNFLSSNFINDEELPVLLAAARSEGAKILPLLVRPCLVKRHPVLSQYQFVNTSANSVNKLLEADRDELYTLLAETTLLEMQHPLPLVKNNQISEKPVLDDLRKMEMQLLNWIVISALSDEAKNTADLDNLLPFYKRKAIVATIEELKEKQIIVRKKVENRICFHLSEIGKSFLVENRSRIAFLGKQ